MQNVSQGYKVNVAKLHFIILWHFGEKPQAGGGILVKIGLSLKKKMPDALVYHTKLFLGNILNW